MTKIQLWITIATLTCLAGQAHAQGFRPRRQRNSGPKVGQLAPDFQAKVLKQKKTIKLQDLVKKSEKPVVLIFGSYT